MSLSAFAQNQPAGGVILNRAPLERMLRDRGAEAIFMNMRGLVTEQVRGALREAERDSEGKPYNINDSREINITRDFLQKPVLQVDQLAQIPTQGSAWIELIRRSYQDSQPKMAEEVIEAELNAWQMFFQQVSNLNSNTTDEEYAAFLDDFFQHKVDGTRSRQSFLSDQIPLFKMQKDVWLASLRKAYEKNATPEDQAWINQSLENWSLFFDENEDWSLFVNYNIDFYPHFQSFSLQHRFLPEGPIAEGVAEVELDPVLHIQSINVFFRNPSTGETISLGLPEVYGADWKLSGSVHAEVPASLDLDLQRTEPVRVDLQAVETNLRSEGLVIRPSDVEAFLKEVLNPERLQTVVAQLKPQVVEGGEAPSTYEEMQTFDRVFRQLESDAVHFLRNQNLEFAAWLVRTESGKIEAKVGVLDDALRAELEVLRQEAESDQQSGEVGTGRASLVAELHTKIPLEIAKASLDFDLDAQSLVANFDLLESRQLSWKVKYFEFPAFLFGEIENPLARNIVNGLKDRNFATDEIEVETDIRFLSPTAGVQARLPLKWEPTANSEISVPQIDREAISIEVPGFEQAKVEELRFRADEHLPWVSLNFNKPQEMSDQVYAQLRPFMQNLQHVTGEDVYELIEREVAGLVQSRLGGLDTELASSGAAPLNPARLKILNFALPQNALEITWDAETETQAATRALNNGLVSGFDYLPKVYEIYNEAPALHRVRTSIRLPREIRLRVENFDHEEAFIRTLEFSLRADKEQELSIHWKFVQDAEGRLLMLPELLNAEQVLKAYRPVTEGTPAQGGPLVEGVVPKGRWARGVDDASRIGSTLGGLMGQTKPEGVLGHLSRWSWQAVGAVSRGVAGVVEDTKEEKISSQLATAIDDASEEMVPTLVNTIVEKSNGYLLRSLTPGEAVLANVDSAQRIQTPAVVGAEQIRAEAVLRALQTRFEDLLADVERGFPVRRSFGEIVFNGKSISELIAEKARNAVVETLDGEGPLNDWPETFTNPGLQNLWQDLSEEVRERVANLPQDNAAAIEGDPQNPDGKQQSINAIIQGPVRTEIQAALNQPFQNLRIASPDPQSSPYPHPDGTPSELKIDLPEFLCIGSASSSPSSDLIPIWAWYQETEESHTNQNPAPQLNSLIERMFEDHPDMGIHAPDALLMLNLEDIQDKIIEPNLEYARRMVNEQLAREQPGTELLIGDIEIRVEEDAQGLRQPYAYAQLRLKQKRGFIRFDSGSEYIEMKVPLAIALHERFNERPETNESEPKAGYGLHISPQYPIEIRDPNSGNLIDHLIKRKIAYPTLAAEIVGSPQYFPIPQTIGLPQAEDAVRIEVQQPRFQTDPSGTAHVFVPLRYDVRPMTDNTYASGIHVALNGLEDRAALESHMRSQITRDDFIFRRWFQQILSDSIDKDRLFSQSRPLEVQFFEPSDGQAFVREDSERPGHLEFRARVQLKQAGENAIQSSQVFEIAVPFEHFEAQNESQKFWILDAASPRFISIPEASSLNPATKDFLNYLKDADARALRLEDFR